MQQYKLDDEQLKLALARQGLTLDEYREGLKKQLTKMKIIQLKVKSRVQVTDQDVQSAYAQQKAIQAVEFRVKARHILFVVPPGAGDDVVSAQRKKALAAKARLDGGADFSKLAAELSDDTASKDRGGSLGEFGRGEMVPEFEHVAFTAKPGVPTEPVRTPFGWHILLVDEHVTSSAAPEHGLDDIRTRLYESEVEQAFKGYLEELRVAAHIEKRI
jgi:parvulin-like peptidyl-prolyl isomerase